MLTFKNFFDKVNKWFYKGSIVDNSVKTKSVIIENKTSTFQKGSLLKRKETVIKSDIANILAKSNQIFGLQKGDLQSSQNLILTFYPDKDHKSIYECHILFPEIISHWDIKKDHLEIYIEKGKQKVHFIYPAYIFIQSEIQRISTWGEKEIYMSGYNGRWLENDKEVQSYIIECFNTIHENYTFGQVNYMSLIWLSKRNKKLHPKVKEEAWKKLGNKYENEY